MQGFERGCQPQPVLRLDDRMRAQPVAGELIETSLVTRGVRGEPDQRGCHITIQGAAQARQNVMTQTVATVRGGGVAGILAKSETMLSEEGLDVSAPPRQQGAMQGEAVGELLQRLHASESGKPGPTAGVGEHRLGLVLGMMREEDIADAEPRTDAGEELMAGLAGGGFNGKPAAFCKRAYVRPADLARQAVLPCETADKSGVLARLAPAQAVVEMADDERSVALLHKPMQEHDRIPPAGDGDEGGKC